MSSKNTCDRCGNDCGTEGVVSVELARKPAERGGGIEHLWVRECHECALKQAREERVNG